jgi:hypothetical protein
MLVSAGLSMDLSMISPGKIDAEQTIAAINNYLKNYINDTQGMTPIIDHDPMQVTPCMVKRSRDEHTGLL